MYEDQMIEAQQQLTGKRLKDARLALEKARIIYRFVQCVAACCSVLQRVAV